MSYRKEMERLLYLYSCLELFGWDLQGKSCPTQILFSVEHSDHPIARVPNSVEPVGILRTSRGYLHKMAAMSVGASQNAEVSHRASYCGGDR